MKNFVFSVICLLPGVASVLAESVAPLRVQFVHVVDGNPLLSDSLRYKTEAGEAYSVTRLGYLVSAFRFVQADGTEALVADTVGFLDALAGRSEVVFPAIPEGEYVTLNFDIGLEEKVNHGDSASYGAAHPLNPAVNRLHWDWQNGYIFTAIEGHWRAENDTAVNGYAYHFARVENRVTITLPMKLLHQKASDVAVRLDVAKILAGLSFTLDGATTHSQPGDPVSEKMKRNLAASFELISAKPVLAGTILQPTVRLEPIDMPENPTPYRFTIPKHVPIPPLPLDNPLIEERVALGKALFETPLFSIDETFSCASCHMSGYGFAEQRPISPGVQGRGSRRNSMTLVNMAWKESFFWDGREKTLRDQVLKPIESPVELANTLPEVVRRLKVSEEFPPLFKKAFGSGKITALNISLALENFLLTKTSFGSKFDRSLKGEAELSAEEKRGMELFFTESEPRMGKKGADCFHCHGGVFFTDHGFHNNGQRDQGDTGQMEVTRKESDRGKFGTPTLRNIEVTFPYMHNGRVRTLENVIDHYDGGFAVTQTLDPNIAKHKGGLGLSAADKKALVAFLKTLTDPAYWEEYPEGRE